MKTRAASVAGRCFGARFVVFAPINRLRIDYKDLRTISSFVTERGKMTPSRITGNCARHQRLLTTAVKSARSVALLPFTTANN